MEHLNEIFSTEQISSIIEKLISGSINLGARILGALIIILIGKLIINWLNRMFANLLQRRKVEASIQGFLRSIVNIILLVYYIAMITYK